MRRINGVPQLTLWLDWAPETIESISPTAHFGFHVDVRSSLGKSKKAGVSRSLRTNRIPILCVYSSRGPSSACIDNLVGSFTDLMIGY
jgi:hypothetical protein